MGIDLYYMSLSAPCRSALLLGKALGLEINAIPTDLWQGEHLTAEYIKMNPQHTIPTLNDNGFSIWESRVIMTYLVSKYDKNGTLYPVDAQKRAVVDQRLYFDMGTLYDRFGKCVYPMMFGDAACVDEEAVKKLKEALQWLDSDFIGDNGYVAGSNITVADYAIVASISTIEESGLVDLSVYPKLSQWFSTCKADMADYDKLNGEGSKKFGELFREKKDGKSK